MYNLHLIISKDFETGEINPRIIFKLILYDISKLIVTNTYLKNICNESINKILS